jgi:hypothetical protein
MSNGDKLVLSLDSRLSTIRLARHALDVFRRDNDLAAKAGVRPDVFKLRRLIRLLMQKLFNASPLARFPIVEFFGPLGFCLDDQRFTIRIKFVGHEESRS